MYIDGTPQPIDLDGQAFPVIVGDDILIPVYPLITATGGTVSIDPNDENIAIEDDRVVEHDSLMMSVNLLAETLDFEIAWDSDTQQVTLTRDFQTRRWTLLI